MARYGRAMKERVVARLLPPESAAIETVAREVGVSVSTLERWRADALSMNDAEQSAWCREHGVYPSELARWRQGAIEALADPEEARAHPKDTRADKKRIKVLERELQRKDRALAEAAALLVLSKKLSAIFPDGADA